MLGRTSQWIGENCRAAAGVGTWVLCLGSALAGCASSGPILGGLDLDPPYAVVAPSETAHAHLESASKAYETEARPAAADLRDVSLRRCLILAVHHNRSLRQSTYAAQRFGLERDVRLSELDEAQLFAKYAVVEGPDRGDATIGAVGRAGGFEVRPFIEFLYEEFESDPTTTSYGVAVSRSVFRIKHEHIRQHLPLTRATKDYHVAINERIVELRELHLEVVRRFYDLHRFASRVQIRQDRVSDAEQFLKGVREKVRAGILAPVEATNADINLNQAHADLVREQTNLQNARETLLDLMGLELRADLAVSEEDLGALAPADLDVESDVSLVREHHERVRNQRLEIEVQKQSHEVSKDELIPDLTATLTTAREVDGDEDDRVDLDLNLSVPLDGYRAERARMTQDRLRLMELNVGLEAIRSDLERQLRARHRAIEQLTTTVDLTDKRLANERQKLATTLKRFENGEIENLEVTRAKSDVDDASVQLLDFRINRIIAKAGYRALLPDEPGGGIHRLSPQRTQRDAED